jgi:hypothetical protein
MTLLGLYLSDRTQYKRSDGEYSTDKGIEYGVPQIEVVPKVRNLGIILNRDHERGSL